MLSAGLGYNTNNAAAAAQKPEGRTDEATREAGRIAPQPEADGPPFDGSREVIQIVHRGTGERGGSEQRHSVVQVR
jgi:hypothetical protein